LIQQIRPDIPVFKLRSTDGIEKVLHRNHLLLIDSNDELNETNWRPTPKPRKTTQNNDSTKSLLPDWREKDEMSSDDEDSDDNVDTTFHGGDAHLSKKVKKGGESKDENAAAKEEEEKEPCTINHVETVAEQTEQTETEDHDEDEVEEIQSIEGDRSEEEIEDDKHTLNITEEEARENIQTSNSPEEAQEDVQISNSPEEENQEDKQTSPEEETENVAPVNKEESQDKVVIPKVRSVDQRPEQLYEPKPKRSNRGKRPEKYKDFIMFSMNMDTRPRDKKLESLEILMKSGIFTSLDTDTVHKLINSIMK
jgi:hypothetical protein